MVPPPAAWAACTAARIASRSSVLSFAPPPKSRILKVRLAGSRRGARAALPMARHAHEQINIPVISDRATHVILRVLFVVRAPFSCMGRECGDAAETGVGLHLFG